MPAFAISNSLSLYPFLIRMVLEETNQELAIGTGFIYEHNSFYYLITNGHCVTRINPETNSRISNKIGFPTIINMRVRQIQGLTTEEIVEHPENIGKELMGMSSMILSIKLYEDDEYAKPRWYIHPHFGYNVDVIAIPLGDSHAIPQYFARHALNTCDIFQEGEGEGLKIEPSVAEDVFILGYPLGITDPFEFPIWKRGSIATEPVLQYNELPMILVDTATRPGMSGSPVILLKNGSAGSGVRLHGSLVNIPGIFFRFLGVYSGRIGLVSETMDAQLGIVWKKEVIEEIIVGKKKGTIEFQRI